MGYSFDKYASTYPYFRQMYQHIVELLSKDADQVIENQVGASLRSDPRFSDVVLEQTCTVILQSSELSDLSQEHMGDLIGILELRSRGVALFLSRLNTPMAWIAPYWKLHFAKGPDALTLFAGEHRLKLRPTSQDLRSFCNALIQIKLTMDSNFS